MKDYLIVFEHENGKGRSIVKLNEFPSLSVLLQMEKEITTKGDIKSVFISNIIELRSEE